MGLQSKGCTLESENDQNQNSATVSHHQNLPVIQNCRNFYSIKETNFFTISHQLILMLCVTEVLPKNTSIPVDEASSKFQVLIILEVINHFVI